MAGALLHWLDELLFPEKILCLCCDRALDGEESICPACMQTLELLAARQEERERTEPIVPPPEIDYVHAAYSYEGPARQLVHRLKYDGVRAAHVPLAQAMALLPSGEEEVIVPVPADEKRRRRRGFNQAQLLAEHVGRTLGMPVSAALVRREARRPQTGLSAAQRRINLVGCMHADASVNGRRVLLVDDVYTTGATAQEAARALLCAGARSVAVFAAAAPMGVQEREKDPFFLPQRKINREKILKKPDKKRVEL